MTEQLLFDENGDVDVEGMVEFRETRKVPPNPPPLAAREDWLNGKALARIAVSECINSNTWANAAVMLYLIDCASRDKGACYPSNATVAKAVNCSERSVRRATQWWRRHGCRLGGRTLPLLSIAVRGRTRPDGTKESNAYHIGWLPLIAVARHEHCRPRVRIHARGILRSAETHWTDLSSSGGQV